MRAANAVGMKQQEALTQGNSMTPYRRSPLLEGAGSNATGVSHFSPPQPLPPHFTSSHSARGHFAHSPGGVRTGRTVTWHNPAHNPDFSVI